MSKQKPASTLHVIARAPFKVYFEGDALAVSTQNRVGPFDVLPGHADFFSVLEPGQVIVDTDKETEPVSFDIQSGILTVRDNSVMIFVNV